MTTREIPRDDWHVVDGYCPSCGQRSLGLNPKTRQVECFFGDCADPLVVADFLSTWSGDAHYVTFGYDGWVLEHSLRCRVDGMLDCEHNERLSDLKGMPRCGLGRFQLEFYGEGLQIRQLDRWVVISA